MPVNTAHPTYQDFEKIWKRCRDASAGEDAVHKAGDDYLPRLADQTKEEYNAYVMRAGWYNATGRTIEGMTGLLFRKPPLIDAPGMDAFVSNVDGQGNALTDFAEQVAAEIMTVNRCGVLIDYPALAPEEVPRTMQELERASLRPFFTLYTTEQIINWKHETVGSDTFLTEVRLAELIEVPNADDPWLVDQEPQIRVLRLLDGRYVIELYREEQGEWVLHSATTPVRGGAPLDRIPFIPFSDKDHSVDIRKPPLLDLINVNFAHYRSMADYEHGCHFTGLPTPYIAGGGASKDDETDYRIGAAVAWTFPDPATKVGYLEFTGAGLTELRENLKAKEERMAAIGARMLAPEKRAAEAAETLIMRHSGENAVLSGIASALERGLTTALEEAAQWTPGGSGGTVEINRDYLATRISAQEITELVKAWMAGAISKETLFWNLQQGEIIEPTLSFDEEEERIGEGPLGGALDQEPPASEAA